MNEVALVIIKPDGLVKKLVSNILSKFEQSNLKLVGIKVARSDRAKVEEHYRHIKGQKFFSGVVSYLSGELHKERRLIMMVLCGKGAIKLSRKIAGATNPEEAAPDSIRGSLGRITTKGIFENVVHVSSNQADARREIKLWFRPDELLLDIYPTKKYTINGKVIREWQ